MQSPKDESGNKNAIQSVGSTVSFLKRYTLESSLGLSSDEDTDVKNPEPPKADPEIERFQMMVDRCNTVDELQLLWEIDVPIDCAHRRPARGSAGSRRWCCRGCSAAPRQRHRSASSTPGCRSGWWPGGGC
ncbi:ERF family protein [Metapseudomonas otitidis]|uniref:ERF family protein n=1 Tax=Metapseudomonas otitidis TaxID=319939 RepID=UPI0039B58051